MNATLTPAVIDTLAKAAAEVALFGKVADAVRTLEADGTRVIVSPSRGEIVVVGNDYTLCALKVTA
jgi:hypothetical protein